MTPPWSNGSLVAAVHAYPWDVLGHPGAVEDAACLGGEVVLAAAYHAVRAATPNHPHHRIVEAPTSALYLPTRQSAWRDSRVQPRAADEWAGPDGYGRAAAELRGAGLGVSAWVVLTHLDGPIGAERSFVADDLHVTNAFGDVLRHALCPSHPDVASYVTTLVTEVCRTQPDRLVVEGCGQMGLEHAGAHEKTSGADWSPGQLELLSVCCCLACRQRWVAHGLTAAEVAGVVDRLRDSATDPGQSLRRALGEAAGVVVGERRAAALSMRRAVVDAAAAAGVAAVAFHASADDAATGPAAAVVDDARGPLPLTWVAHCWGGDGVAALTALRDRAGHEGRLAAYVSLLPPHRPRRPISLAAGPGSWTPAPRSSTCTTWAWPPRSAFEQRPRPFTCSTQHDHDEPRS